jgi:hypothetical protein
MPNGFQSAIKSRSALAVWLFAFIALSLTTLVLFNSCVYMRVI